MNNIKMVKFPKVNSVPMVLLLSMLLFFCASPNGTDNGPTAVWQDEFEYEGAPDPDYWTFDEGDGCPRLCGWGNNELQYYTRRPENVRVENGKLIIEARREAFGSKRYTSARMRATHSVSRTYGYVEVKAKLPFGRGTWPAIWMLPDSATYGGWPRSGEIDIMEHVGFDPGVVHGTVHTESFNHMKGTQVGKQRRVDGFDNAFHVYAINWTPDRIEFFIDGEQYHLFENNGDGTDAWPFDHAFHLIMNIAVGGGWGGREGVDESIWPQRMEVEYVRVYEPLNETQKAIMLRTAEK